MSVRCTVLVHGQPAKAPMSQDLLAIPSPFAQAVSEEQPQKKVKKEVQVKKEMQCYRCDHATKKSACGTQPPVTCDPCCASYVLCQAKVSSQVWFPGFQILCYRNDWLPVDHPYVPICSMIVESLFEVAWEKGHFGCILLQVVFTNVFCTCLLCKGVHGECARMRANFLGSCTTDICTYPRALMPRIYYLCPMPRISALYPVAYISGRYLWYMPRDTTQISVA